MEKKQALKIFEETGALQNGHFLLTSGLHSPQYFQCALVLQYPNYLHSLSYEIADFYQEEEIDVVIAPAIGGIVVAQEVGRLVNARSIFSERDDGRMTLRRGFNIDSGERVLICEDVLTTGGSVKEVIQLVEEANAWPLGVGAIVDRSGGGIEFEIPNFSAVQVKAVTYKPDKCPLCRQNIPLMKPGSRDLSK